MAVPFPPPGFDDLSIDEKIDYVQFLWERIAVHPEAIPVPDWHLELVRESLAEYEADPESGNVSWEEFRDGLLLKLDDRASER